MSVSAHRHRSIALACALAAAALSLAAGCGNVSEQPSDCTAPCAGDATVDFSEAQGGTNGRWLYLADTRSVAGADYIEMTRGEVRGVAAWIGDAGVSPPGIYSCADNPDATGCENLETFLMFVPGTDQDPVIAFVAPSNGTYALTGKARAATGDPEGLTMRYALSRNGRSDLIDSRIHVTSPTPDDFSAEVEMLAGDRLMLTFLGNLQSAVPVAFDFHLTLIADGAAAFPGACEMALTFDGSNPLDNPCRGPVENLNDEIGPSGTSVNGPSINSAFGQGRVFQFGQYLRGTGGPLDKSGDFTIQWWAKLTEPQEFQSVMFADWNNLVDGGINVAPGQTGQMYLGSMFGGGDASVVEGTRPTDGQWHFFRVTRSASEGVIELCIDGELSTSDPAVGSADMTGDQLPHIARNIDFNPAYFQGTIDDFRAFKRALPCPSPN
jgi:hypothetical protein